MRRTVSFLVILMMMFLMLQFPSFGIEMTISDPVILGVTVPVKGATPVSAIAETTEYTATISWDGAPVTFAADTIYTATITITPKAGYTLTGVVADFFTVAGATATNPADSGIITAVFPKTEADVPPLLVRATTNTTGDTVTLEFDKNMADPSADAASFIVRINGFSYYDVQVSKAVVVSSAALNADPTKIDLSLASPLYRGDIITVEYLLGTVTAADGSALASFGPQSVHNAIPVVIVTNLPGTWQIYDHVGNWGEDPYPLPNSDDPRGSAYNRHIITNGSTVYFFGNGMRPFKDFLYLPSSDTAAKSFTFDLDLSGVKYHSMEGGGFLFNASIDSGLISGYCALFINNYGTYAVDLYKIDGVDLDDFHNGDGDYYNLSASPSGITTLGTFPLSIGDLHTITLECSANSVDMWDGNTKLIDNFTLPTVYSNGVGIIGSYQSHWCNELSYFVFSDLNIQGIADLSASLVGIGQSAELAFTTPVGATAVSVEQSLDGTNWTTSSITGSINQASSTATVTGLAGYKTYHFRLVIEGGKYDGYSRVATATYIPGTEPTPTPTTRPSISTVPNVALALTIEGPGTAAPGSGAYSLDSIVQFSVVPDDGAVFVGWFGDNGVEVTNNRLTMNANKAVTARFAIPVETIPEGLPIVTPVPTPVPETDITIIETPADVPLADPLLPKTAGIPVSTFYGIGTILLIIGSIKKNRIGGSSH